MAITVPPLDAGLVGGIKIHHGLDHHSRHVTDAAGCRLSIAVRARIKTAGIVFVRPGKAGNAGLPVLQAAGCAALLPRFGETNYFESSSKTRKFYREAGRLPLAQRRPARALRALPRNIGCAAHPAYSLDVGGTDWYIFYPMETDSRKYQRMRESMVKNQIEARDITDSAVLSAMRRVPRHMFVSEALMDQAYSDHPLPIGEQQTISQPYIVAHMTQALQLDENDRVLEIGTGSGYQAAVLAEIAYRVYTVEKIRSLHIRARQIFDQLKYMNIVTRYSDGTLGWREESPFDAVLVTAGAPDIPKTLVDQLGMGGRMVIPVGQSFSQELIKVYRDEKGIHQTRLGGCRFVKLVGEHGWESP